jgi:hypothetical protein
MYLFIYIYIYIYIYIDTLTKNTAEMAQFQIQQHC